MLAVLWALPCVCAADDDADMTFDLDEITGPADTGGGAPANTGGDTMTFEVVDTEKAASKFEAEKQAEQDLIRVIQHRPFLRLTFRSCARPFVRSLL